MASVERPSFTQAVPAGASVKERDGERLACWTDRKGQKVEALLLPSGKCRRTVAGRWFGVYRDHAGKKVKTPTFGSRAATLEAAVNAEKRAVAVREGRAPPDRPKGKVKLRAHVDEYLAFLVQKGTGEKRVADAKSTLLHAVSEYGLTYASSVDAERVARLLEKDRADGGLSLRTRNYWTVTLRAFGRWLYESGRTEHNPFRGLPTVNHERDRRRVRRAFTPAELMAVVKAAGKSAEVVEGLDGADRSALYTLAAYSGLRAGALFALTPESFTLNPKGVPTAVYSTARRQKAGVAHGVPLAADAGKRLTQWLKGNAAGKPVFHRRPKSRPRTADMLKADMAAAGVSFADGSGRVGDFHALRLTFGVMLARSGVSLVAAQQLLGHSTPTLTANVYSQFGGELADEVAKLPPLGSPLGAKGGESRRK